MGEAEALYWKVLNVERSNPAALQHLALLAHRYGRIDEGIGLLQLSLAGTPRTIPSVITI